MKRAATSEEKTSSERIKYLIDTYCNGSQNEFARRVGIGKSSVSQYVNGTNFPGSIRAKQIADVFSVEPMWVMGFQSEMRVESPRKTFALTAEEKSIIDAYRAASTDIKNATCAVLGVKRDPGIEEDADYLGA